MFSSASPPCLQEHKPIQEQYVFLPYLDMVTALNTRKDITLSMHMTSCVLGHMTILCYMIKVMSKDMYMVNGFTAVGKQS